MVTLATGTAVPCCLPQPKAARFGDEIKAKVKKLGRCITVGEDTYDTADHVTNLRAINVTPHVARNDSITSTASIAVAPSNIAAVAADFLLKELRPRA